MTDEMAQLSNRLGVLEQKVDAQQQRFEYVTQNMTEKIKETAEIVESMRTLNVSVTKLTEQIRYNNNEISSMKTQLAEINNQPSAKWINLTNAITAAITSGIIAFVISVIFK